MANTDHIWLPFKKNNINPTNYGEDSLDVVKVRSHHVYTYTNTYTL